MQVSFVLSESSISGSSDSGTGAWTLLRDCFSPVGVGFFLAVFAGCWLSVFTDRLFTSFTALLLVVLSVCWSTVLTDCWFIVLSVCWVGVLLGFYYFPFALSSDFSRVYGSFKWIWKGLIFSATHGYFLLH